MSRPYSEELLGLQVELSTVCNALCLGCVRTDQNNFKKIKPTIPKGKYLNVDLLLQRLSELQRPLELIEFCGNIDEPTLHPELFSFLDRYVEVSPDTFVSIHTNGGTHTPAYFTELAKKLARFRDHHVRFSIDGLGDTHAIYRQNTSYEKTIQNARAFIEAGGKATWQFIVFPWNPHQVEEAEALAGQMGFKNFWVRKDRSMTGKTYENYLRSVEQSKSPASVTPEKSSSPPPIPFSPSTNPRGEYFPHHLRSQAGSEIDCFFKKIKLMFLSWDAKLWPCCFMSNVYYETLQDKVAFFHENFYRGQSENFNSIEAHTFSEILASPIYSNDLVESWDSKTPTEKKIWRCVEKCSSHEGKKEPLKTVALL